MVIKENGQIVDDGRRMHWNYFSPFTLFHYVNEINRNNYLNGKEKQEFFELKLVVMRNRDVPVSY